MQLVTVRLDRIFDVVHGKHEKKAVTFFGFEYGRKKVFGVIGPGRQHLQAGAVLTACLGKENDWTTLAGWYNHSTGEVVVESAGYGLFSVIIESAVAAVPLLLGYHGSPSLLLVSLVMAALGYSSFCSLRVLRQVRAQLERVKEAPVPPLALAPGEEGANALEVQHCVSAAGKPDRTP
ncbi:hypothetical protein LXA47_20270 [Massilia sp. P8910]|uniref:hypothetical protein n=1 Tax=Massilia antarctica TaxID=2765360 RepID=UPI001E344409|nr:hypothetical protein [Massilia antarctica]MCE3605922.1 hypothetical protein [Massilia antarctica]